jgi:hypothetical protein
MIDFWLVARSPTGPSALIGDAGVRIPIRLRDDMPRDGAIDRSRWVAERLIKRFNGPTVIEGGPGIWRPKENA